jgi:hypothetical protein
VETEAEASPPTRPPGRGVITPGHYTATLGAITLIVSLFLPWYTLNLPPGAEEALDEQTRGLPEGLRELSRSFAQELIDSVGGTAWEVFSSADIVLLACGIVVLGVTLWTLATRGASTALPPARAARLIALVGAGASALVVVKILDQPGPNLLLDLDYGPFVALAGTVAMALGGLAARDRARNVA